MFICEMGLLQISPLNPPAKVPSNVQLGNGIAVKRPALRCRKILCSSQFVKSETQTAQKLGPEGRLSMLLPQHERASFCHLPGVVPKDSPLEILLPGPLWPPTLIPTARDRFPPSASFPPYFLSRSCGCEDSPHSTQDRAEDSIYCLHRICLSDLTSDPIISSQQLLCNLMKVWGGVSHPAPGSGSRL